MINDSASRRVFEILELTRLVAGQLILKRRGSAVNLACACRHLEEPVLSTLWETQESPCTLLETLPRDTWNWDNSAQGGPVVCPESPVGETERSVIISVQTRGGSVAGGLEQSPPIRVLDASNHCGWLGGPRRRDIPQITPQYTSRRMVSSTARLILVHQEIQSSSYRPILLPKFEEDFHLYLMG